MKNKRVFVVLAMLFISGLGLSQLLNSKQDVRVQSQTVNSAKVQTFDSAIPLYLKEIPGVDLIAHETYEKAQENQIIEQRAKKAEDSKEIEIAEETEVVELEEMNVENSTNNQVAQLTSNTETTQVAQSTQKSETPKQVATSTNTNKNQSSNNNQNSGSNNQAVAPKPSQPTQPKAPEPPKNDKVNYPSFIYEVGNSGKIFDSYEVAYAWGDKEAFNNIRSVDNPNGYSRFGVRTYRKNDNSPEQWTVEFGFD